MLFSFIGVLLSSGGVASCPTLLSRVDSKTNGPTGKGHLASGHAQDESRSTQRRAAAVGQRGAECPPETVSDPATKAGSCDTRMRRIAAARERRAGRQTSHGTEP